MLLKLGANFQIAIQINIRFVTMELFPQINFFNFVSCILLLFLKKKSGKREIRRVIH